MEISEVLIEDSSVIDLNDWKDGVFINRNEKAMGRAVMRKFRNSGSYMLTMRYLLDIRVEMLTRQLGMSLEFQNLRLQI